MADRNTERRRESQRAYAAQREALHRAHARSAVDVFVSPFDILRRGDGTELSYSTWPEGVVTWLPRTDCIAFTGTQDAQRWYMIVPWDSALQICKGAVEPVLDVDPTRFQTLEWPDAGILRRLSKLAILRK